MLKRDGVDPVFNHQWMGSLEFPVAVELFLQQRIGGTVDQERRPRHTTDTQASVEVEATAATAEEIDLRPADLEGLGAARIVDVP